MPTAKLLLVRVIATEYNTPITLSTQRYWTWIFHIGPMLKFWKMAKYFFPALETYFASRYSLSNNYISPKKIYRLIWKVLMGIEEICMATVQFNIHTRITETCSYFHISALWRSCERGSVKRWVFFSQWSFKRKFAVKTGIMLTIISNEIVNR